MADDRVTAAAAPPSRARRYRCFRIEVIDGPCRGATWSAAGERCAVGSHRSNDLVLDDPTVSRFHCEIVAEGATFRVRDAGSRNRTLANEVSIVEGAVGADTVLVLGHSRIRIAVDDAEREVPASAGARFGTLVGSSTMMREVFARLERAAGSASPVLLEGETGTGKEGAAAAIHAASVRARGPFVAVDCGAIPATLFEAELFGSEPGAFTGATRRIGALEEASGGTLFLDEAGELALDNQAKLLRALETRTIRRLGSRTEIECDVRLVAATNRDLRECVNRGTFRPDLYYRLAVLPIRLPALRDRPGDLPELVAHLLERLGAPPARVAELTAPDRVAELAAGRWPGNVRELRNHLEQLLVFGAPAEPATAAPLGSYELARRAALDQFERGYVTRLLREASGDVAQAASVAGVNRAYLYRLIKRHR